MKSLFRFIGTGLFSALLCFSFALAPVYAKGNGQPGTNGGNSQTENGEGGSGLPEDCDNATGLNAARCGQEAVNPGEHRDITEIVRTVLNAVLFVVGVVSAVMIVLGGIHYVLSQGDPQKAAKAKVTIMNSIIGLVIVLCAFPIINFVINALAK